MRHAIPVALSIVIALGSDISLALYDAGAPGSPQATQCVDFETSSRLAAGESYTKPIGRGLEVRLMWDRRSAWIISVGPAGSPDDYLWVVSPPIQTAPHLVIGEGYNVTAPQSAAMSPRRFQFVTSEQEYKDAREFLARLETGASGAITVADLERKGKGSLQLWITGFERGESPAGLAWIRVKGRACQPR